MSQTDQYGRYLAELDWAALGDEPRRLARRSLLDWMGVTLAGLAEPSSRTLADLLRRRLSLPNDTASMALLLGYAGYTSEFEQTHIPSISHISTVMWPALFDWRWSRPAGSPFDIREWLAAFVGGFEVAARIGRVLGPPLYAKGWHPTPIFGAIGAAAAVARCAGGYAETIAAAIGTASALIGGGQATFGTHAVALGVGNAAHLGQLCGDLAAQGFEGPHGLAEASGQSLWNMLEPNIPPLAPPPAGASEELRWNAFKAYPSALFTHAAVECALQLRRDVPAREAKRIEITLSPDALARVDRPVSANPEQARYSVQYNVRQAWLGGRVVPATFSEHAIEQANAAPFASIVVSSDPQLTKFGARLSVSSAGGASHTAEVLGPCGFPERPMTEADLRSKFASCAGPFLGDETAGRAADWLLEGELEDLDRAADLFRLSVEKIVRSPQAAGP